MLEEIYFDDSFLSSRFMWGFGCNDAASHTARGVIYNYIKYN